MRCWLAVWLFASACSFSGSGSGGIDAAPRGDAPPSTGDDAAVGDAPAGLDGSGSGACTPASAHDEDGDGVVDDCDPCPQIAHEDATDGDGDGVPDACDPRPATSGDHLVKLFTFAATGGDLAALGWTATAGTLTPWTHVGDDISIVQGSGTQIIEYNAGFANMAIDVGFDVAAHTAAAGARHQQFFDELVNASTNGDSYIAAGFYYDGNGNGRELFDYDSQRSTNNGFLPLVDSATDPPSALHTYRMTLLSTTNLPQYVSTASGGDIALSESDTRHPNQHIGLRTQNASTVIHYIALYGY